jgi:hypothetical protein
LHEPLVRDRLLNLGFGYSIVAAAPAEFQARVEAASARFS